MGLETKRPSRREGLERNGVKAAGPATGAEGGIADNKDLKATNKSPRLPEDTIQ
jgi:hypothetical protein